jgi:hypothetical protein
LSGARLLGEASFVAGSFAAGAGGCFRGPSGGACRVGGIGSDVIFGGACRVGGIGSDVIFGLGCLLGASPGASRLGATGVVSSLGFRGDFSISGALR